MSVFLLKLIAIVSMFIDHLTYVARLSRFLPRGHLYFLGRAVGRPAFVIFCFLLVNGFDRTRDRKRYLSRLVLFALIAQVPYSLAFSAENYSGTAAASCSYRVLAALPMLLPLLAWYLYVCRRRFEPSLLWLAAALAIAPLDLCAGGLWLTVHTDLNVFYTLAVSMATMMFFDSLRSEERNWGKTLLIAAALAAVLYFVQSDADYDYAGVILILSLYFCRGEKLPQLAVAALWCLFEYRGYWPYQLGALAALLPLALYNRSLGPKMRTAFYVFYPAHLTLLGVVFMLLARK